MVQLSHDSGVASLIHSLGGGKWWVQPLERVESWGFRELAGLVSLGSAIALELAFRRELRCLWKRKAEWPPILIYLAVPPGTPWYFPSKFQVPPPFHGLPSRTRSPWAGEGLCPPWNAPGPWLGGDAAALRNIWLAAIVLYLVLLAKHMAETDGSVKTEAR